MKTKPYFTVADLISHLQTLPPQNAVGRVGNFGEFYPMTASDFFVRSAWVGPRFGVQAPIDALDINPPDIGPDPD